MGVVNLIKHSIIVALLSVLDNQSHYVNISSVLNSQEKSQHLRKRIQVCTIVGNVSITGLDTSDLAKVFLLGGALSSHGSTQGSSHVIPKMLFMF